MFEEKYNQIKKLIKMTNEINKKELDDINNLVSYIIKHNVKDEYLISMAFDKILSLVFVDIEEVKKIFYKLLNYTKNIDKSLSEDYEKIFIEQFIDDEIENSKKYYKKY